MKSAALLLLGLAVALPISAAADTFFTLEIDPDSSSFSQSCLSGCDPGPFAITGRFELRILDQGWGYGNLRLSNESVATETLTDPFNFPSFFAELIGQDVRGSADACDWPGISGSGLCISSGFLDSFSGSFDGATLHITGIDHLSLHRRPSYNYEIVATVIPEPSSVTLTASGILMLALLRRRGHPSRKCD